MTVAAEVGWRSPRVGDHLVKNQLISMRSCYVGRVISPLLGKQRPKSLQSKQRLLCH